MGGVVVGVGGSHKINMIVNMYSDTNEMNNAIMNLFAAIEYPLSICWHVV